MRTCDVYKSMFFKMDASFKTSVKARKLSVAMHKDWSLQCHFLVLKSGPPFLTVVERGSFSNLHND